MFINRWQGILVSFKKEQNNAICSNMDGSRDYHTKGSKSDKDKYYMNYFYVEIYKKYGTKEPIYKTEIDSQIGRLGLT